jgi:hypothetical protein
MQGLPTAMPHTSTHRIPRLLACGLVAFLTLGCSRSGVEAPEHAAQSIRARAIDAHGAYLSSDALSGRHFASPAGVSAVAYIVRALAASGIDPAVVAADLIGPEPRSYTHVFSVPLHRLGARTWLGAETRFGQRTARLGRDFLPLVFARNERLSGRIVALDATASVEEQPQVNGRIVLVDAATLGVHAGDAWDAELFETVRALEHRGAAAVLFTGIDDWFRLPSATYPEFLPTELLERCRSPRGMRENLSPDRAAGIAQAAAWRHAAERTIPALVVRPGWERGLEAKDEIGIETDLVAEVSLGQNVLVGMGGDAGRHDAIVLAAHYDHAGVNAAGEILNAADDNASGVAALIEVASALARVHDRLRSPVLLAFVSAEKHGAVGTEMMLRDLEALVGNVQPRALLYLDAVGRNGSDPLRITATPRTSDMLRLLEQLNTRRSLGAPALLIETTPATVSAGMDAGVETTLQLFARAGIPTLRWNDGLDPMLYGLPEDDWTLVDVHKLVRVARLAFLATYRLATEPAAATRPVAAAP